MKKVFFVIAFAALTLGMNAQHVAPLNIQLTEFNLDTLRVKFVNDKQMYSTELQHIVLLQDAEQQAIKEAWKELKDEKAHAKNVASCLKDVNSSITNLGKSAEKEIDVLKGMIRSIEKQQKDVRGLKKLKAETRDEYIEYLETEKRYLNAMLDNLTSRQKELSNALTGAQVKEAALNAFNLEIQQKELDLKQLETTSKARAEQIKAEQKIVKEMLKNK